MGCQQCSVFSRCSGCPFQAAFHSAFHFHPAARELFMLLSAIKPFSVIAELFQWFSASVAKPYFCHKFTTYKVNYGAAAGTI